MLPEAQTIRDFISMFEFSKKVVVQWPDGQLTSITKKGMAELLAALEVYVEVSEVEDKV